MTMGEFMSGWRDTEAMMGTPHDEGATDEMINEHFYAFETNQSGFLERAEFELAY